MESLKSMLEDLRERKFAFFAIIAIVVIVAISVLSNIADSQRQFLAKGPGGNALNTDSNSSYVQSASTGNSTQTDDSASSTSSVPQTPSVPFSIKTVTLEGTSWKCDSGKVTLLVTSARVDAASSVGGTFKWQLEVTGSSIPTSPMSSSVAMSRNQISFKLSGGDSGYLYSSADARDGQSVRVHVTSPNDISSTLFTVPAGTVAACAQQQPQPTSQP